MNSCCWQYQDTRQRTTRMMPGQEAEKRAADLESALHRMRNNNVSPKECANSPFLATSSMPFTHRNLERVTKTKKGIFMERGVEFHKDRHNFHICLSTAARPILPIPTLTRSSSSAGCIARKILHPTYGMSKEFLDKVNARRNNSPSKARLKQNINNNCALELYIRYG